MESIGLSDEGAYEVVLPEFEGPLDLLLHLVKRHELSIFDIPIAFITEKYLEYLDLMRSLDLDVAGEYLLMAATLAYIKSREMLPRKDDGEPLSEDEEGLDPREELIRRLLEYQKYKEVALRLGERPMLGRQVFPRGSETEVVEPSQQPLQEVSVFALIEALARVLSQSRRELTHDVVVDRISITDRINEMVDLLRERTSMRLLDCFTLEGSLAQVRHELVVTFLAMLEMARLRMIRILQHSPEGEIYLTSTEALHAVGATEAGEGQYQ